MAVSFRGRGGPGSVERLDGQLESFAGVGDDVETGVNRPMITIPGLGIRCPLLGGEVAGGRGVVEVAVAVRPLLASRIVVTPTPTSSTIPTYSCPIGDGP